MKNVCEICGWAYDEQKGDAALDIEPGTPFSEFPEAFECPMCYAGKEDFISEEE